MTGAGTTGEDRGAWAGSGGYSQVGKGSQVAEGALGEAGDVVAVEGSEAEAQVRSAPVTGGRARHSPGAPWLAWCPSVSMAAPAAAAGDPPPSHGECVNISPPSSEAGVLRGGVWGRRGVNRPGMESERSPLRLRDNG